MANLMIICLMFVQSGLIQKHFEFLGLKVSFAPNKRSQAANERNHHMMFVFFLIQMVTNGNQLYKQ